MRGESARFRRFHNLEAPAFGEEFVYWLWKMWDIRLVVPVAS